MNRAGAAIAFAAPVATQNRVLMTIKKRLIALACLAPLSAQAQTAGNAEMGEMTYTDYCATCHGEKLRNTSEGVTFDLRKLRAEDYPRFKNSVLNGKNNMPPWNGVLDESQISDIWAYIRASAGS